METFLLPDGGRLWEEPGSRRHKVGDRWLPSPVIYEYPGDKKEPAYRLKFEVWEGVPVCTEIRLMAKQAERVHIRPKDVKLVANRLENSLHDWLAFLEYERIAPGKFVRRDIPSEEQIRATRRVIQTARGQTRRKMTDEHLRAVANAVSTATGPPVEAVSAVFGVSIRTAWRYIEKAREEGFIDE
ncbi:Uncharacterised protein [Mycolicibacterium flavescens]|uniref:hypothetical protein n=1 Tax=Mycobacterium neumannii TaxID=2048551 RepID=UPI000B943884|nr:hypothetical protein [Mycobacterium neumannii]VEG40277.1 Uncharacterised protein [Mycolicibacterium flavescens]